VAIELTRPEKIISGGQTGADRAALDVAMELGIATGGWVPHGRRAEDGKIPARYSGLVETETDTYEHRTALNVRDADATLIFHYGSPAGGTALTLRLAGASSRPCLAIDLDAVSEADAARQICVWLSDSAIRTLNVAGPRASREPRIAAAVANVLRAALEGDTGT
jgi:hypothetical protein